jgi:hypothetical protein
MSEQTRTQIKAPTKTPTRSLLLLSSLAFALCGFHAQAAPPDHPQPLAGPFATPVTNASIDDAASAEWVGGSERRVADPVGLHHVVWTRETAPPTGAEFQFGKSAEPGLRSLRIGFKEEIAVGSILVRGGDQLSVLRPGAAYPGNLATDAQWIPAERIVDHQPSAAEVPATDYALWVLPPGTRTRALRFTHTSTAADQNFAGGLGGVYLLAGRYANLAPDAAVSTSANAPAAPLLTNLKQDGMRTWDNGPTYPHPVTRATPESISLVWRSPVSLSGLAALWAGFNAADTETFTGPANVDPLSAPASQWQKIGPEYTLHNQYPRWFGLDWLDFGKTVTTRAIRLRITAVTDETRHPHLVGKTKNGTRVWLGEIMALSPLSAGELKAAVAVGAPVAGPHPPIPIHFTLPAPAYVTLVIDDAKGNRVRNLVSNTLFPAGANTAWWDGSDDLGRTPDAAEHGIYLIPTHFVAPGHYTVRGITHSAIDLHYEMSIYNPGTPPWETADTTGGWLTNHTPGSAALFVPADRAIVGSKPMVYLGSYVSEGGAALAWVDLDGHKQGGRGWIGGTWTGAPYLARDTGPGPDHAIYVGSVYGDRKATAPEAPMQLRITALTGHGDRAVLNYNFPSGGRRDPDETNSAYMDQIAGLSVRNGVLVASLAMRNELALVDAAAGRLIGLLNVPDPRGSVFDTEGNLLLLSGKRLLRYRLPAGGISPQITPQSFGAAEVLVSSGLEDPVGITLDSSGGSIYISDRGSSQQIKVFSAQGKLLRTIGHAGAPAAGPYDPLHMNNPRGLAIDSNQHLWVAEEDFQPKRISVWTLDGKLVNAFYGPAEYGGGGSLDPIDKTKFYYHAMEFKLDWRTGTSVPSAVLYRARKGDLVLPLHGDPENVLYSNGHRYFTNSYLGHGTNGVTIGMLYLDEGGVLHPAAAFGRANDWPVLQGEAFRAKLPPGSDLSQHVIARSVLFAWSDLNRNGRVEPDEVSFAKAGTASITIEAGAEGPVMLDAYLDGKAERFAPVRLLPNGTPVYDITHSTVVSDSAQLPPSDGGGQLLTSAQATVLTTAPKPFAREGIGGFDKQGHSWSYPSLWPGLHASHSAPVADHPGELLGTTRLLGGFIPSPAPGVGDLWGINSNEGDMYLFTADGLFVTQLFQDVRTGKPWNMPLAQRNMLLNDVSLHDENFFPSLTETKDGQVYVVDGGRTSIVRVEGLNTLKRLPEIGIDVAKSDIDAAQSFLVNREAARQQSTGPQTLQVILRSGAALPLRDLPSILASATWATVDRRITQLGWNGKPDLVEAAVTIASGHLYAAFRTSDPNLLKNSGAIANAAFKTGGALDLMIGTSPSADPARKTPVAGDLRLLVYQVNGKTRATLYRPVVKGAANPVPFSSPDRTITIDQVQDVSDQVQLDATGGVYSLAIPLSVLGLTPHAGEAIKADIGILRGNGHQTTQRVYWSNKATGITSDVPSEAALTPNLWGTWVFQDAP